MDISTTKESDVEEQQHRGHFILGYEKIFVHMPLDLKKKKNFTKESFY